MAISLCIISVFCQDIWVKICYFQADIAYIPFVERFQIFLSEVFKYDITAGRPKLAAWIEVSFESYTYMCIYMYTHMGRGVSETLCSQVTQVRLEKNFEHISVIIEPSSSLSNSSYDIE